jgi:hypothetical protein
MKIQFTKRALGHGWATKGENVTAKEIKEAVQDDMLAHLKENMWLGVIEDPLGKFQGTKEYDEEFVTQLNRIAKFFGYQQEFVKTPFEGQLFDGDDVYWGEDFKGLGSDFKGLGSKD